MAAATGRPHPQAFQSLTEDFEVISDEAASSGLTTPSPDEASSRALNIPLLAQTASESDVQRLAKEISQVSERHSSICSGLSDTRSSLTQLHCGMSERIQKLNQNMVSMEAELVAKAEQCNNLQSDNRRLSDELAKLRNKEEVWAQNREDYRKLKNSYDLLTNTKARLESEKADLIKDKEAKLAAETAAMRQKFEKDLTAEVEAETAKWEAKLSECKAAHEAAVGLLRDQLECDSRKAIEELRAELQAEIASVRGELDCTVTGKQKALTDMLAKHEEALAQVRRECEVRIEQQAALVAEAKHELDACTQKHEAEKQELLDMLNEHNNRSLAREQNWHSAPQSDVSIVLCTNSGSSGTLELTDGPGDGARQGNLAVGIESASQTTATVVDVDAVSALAPCSCGRISSFQAALERPAVQEQGTSSIPLPVPVDVAVMTEAASLAETSDIGVTASIDMAQSAMVAVQTEEAVQAEFQVANSESLQRESAVRNLQMQLARVVTSLRIEREEKEALEAKLRDRQVECEDLRRKQFDASRQDHQRIELLEQLTSKQSEELRKKQSQLDSLLEDFDETRHKVYELTDQRKEQLSLLAAADARSAKLTGQIQLLESQARSATEVHSKEPVRLAGSAGPVQQVDKKIVQLTENLAKKQTEIGSLLNDLDVTRTQLYEFMQKDKDHQAELAVCEVQAEKLRQRIRELETQAHLDTEQQRLELDNARKEAGHLAGSAGRVQQLDEKLLNKQAEIESLVKDLDETRNKLYIALDRDKDQQSRLTVNSAQAEKLQQRIQELEIQARSENEQHEMKLDSLRKEQQFKETKLQAAEKEAEQMRQEVQRLKGVQDELNRQCRENQETVQQVMANSDQEKRQMEEEIRKLKANMEAQTEALEANARTLEQKAALEMQLRETINGLVEQLKRKADETDEKIREEKRKQDALYNKLCDQSDQHQSAVQQLNQSNCRLRLAEQKLDQATQRLQDVEASMQSYSTSLEEQVKGMKTQLQESSRKRDEALKLAELMRTRLQEEHQRSASIETELSRLQLEHTRVRADYSQMEQSVTQKLAKEHEMQTQMEQTQARLRQAEEAIGHLKVQIRDKDIKATEFFLREEKLRTERDKLTERVNNLIGELTMHEQQQQQSPPNDLLERHRTRPPAGGNR